MRKSLSKESLKSKTTAKRVLIADDDRALVEVLTRRCEQLGLSGTPAVQADYEQNHIRSKAAREFYPASHRLVTQFQDLPLSRRSPCFKIAICQFRIAFLVDHRHTIWNASHPGDFRRVL